MCGILGFYNFSKNSLNSNIEVVKILMEESFSRGKEASGLAITDYENKVHIIKSDLDGRRLSKTSEYKKMLSALGEKNVRAAIGHSRIATHGLQLFQGNNQPVISEDNRIIAIHNGIVTNADEFWNYAGKTTPAPELDTISLVEYYRHLLNNYDKHNAIEKIYSKIEGAASLGIIDTYDNSFILTTNTGSLYYVFDSTGNRIFFASEKYLLIRF